MSRKPVETWICGGQIKAARDLLWITQAELAKQSGVGIATIKNYELIRGRIARDPDTMQRLVRYLGRRVTFIAPDKDGGAGVRLKH